MIPANVAFFHLHDPGIVRIDRAARAQRAVTFGDAARVGRDPNAALGNAHGRSGPFAVVGNAMAVNQRRSIAKTGNPLRNL